MNTKKKNPLEVRECDYKGEHYSVREDGMIMRHTRLGLRKRKLDEVWTFGIPNYHTGYMEFGGERVHRIVATAFHGDAPSDQHVVDHIDTNRQNNRPDNLRWVTKLENILLNEFTRKKVELICGSVEAFLNDPTLLFGYETEDKNFSWMKNVTPEEAKNCLDNWKHWAKTAAPNLNYKREEHHVGNWIFDKPSFSSSSQHETIVPQARQADFVNPYMNKVPNKSGGYSSVDELQTVPELPISEIDEKEYDDTTESLTPSARQRYWKTPTAFPFCPENVSEDGLQMYLSNLIVGEVFSKNDRYDPYYVVDKGIGKDNKSLIVLTTNRKDEFLSWAITTITIENHKYVHENTEAKAGKELSIKLFKFLTGQGELSEDDINMLDAIS